MNHFDNPNQGNIQSSKLYSVHFHKDAKSGGLNR